MQSRRVRENFEKSEQGRSKKVISVLESKGCCRSEERSESVPDSYWCPQEGAEKNRQAHYLKWASHLLITSGQRQQYTARLTATASEAKKHLGRLGWSPVVGLSFEEAKAIASVFVPTQPPGRLQLMRESRSSKLDVSHLQTTCHDRGNLKVPGRQGRPHPPDILADCWERTKDTEVPQFRDGECEVRCLWDEAVAEAMGWEAG